MRRREAPERRSFVKKFRTTIKSRLELFKKSRLMKRAVVGYLLMGVIPAIVITILVSYVYVDESERMSSSLIDQNSMQYETIVQERLDNYKTVMYSLITEKDLIQIAADMDAGESDITERQRLREKLISYVYTYDEIRGAAFIADNTSYVDYSKYYGTSAQISWSETGMRQRILDRVQDMQHMTYVPMSNLRESGTGVDYVILMGLPVRNLYTKERYGVLILALSGQVLQFRQSDQTSGMLESVIVDSGERIVAGTDNEYLNMALSDYVAAQFGNSSISLLDHAIDGTGWTIINIVNESFIHRQIMDVLGSVILVIVLITIVFFVVVSRFVYGYVRRVNRISETIEHFEPGAGKPEIPEVPDGDELNSIVQGFRKMAKHNNELIDTIQKRNQEILKAEKEQRHAEIVALEAQINPHFLYNTLDSINWRAIDAGQEEISNMLGMLGSLLRYSVSNIDVLVLFRAEIEWIKKYIFFQRDRFNQSFDCVYDVTEEALDFPVYKMLLQPLIENSIIHAFDGVKEGGLIRIRSFVRADGKLEIHVSDNGRGMDEKTLEEIRSNVLSDEKLNSRSIGISNVVSRLHVYYHGQAEIHIQSAPDQGTEVTIIIPDDKNVRDSV